MRMLIAAVLALGTGYLGSAVGWLGAGGGFLGEHPAPAAGLLLAGGLVVGIAGGERWWIAALCAWPALLVVLVSFGGGLLGGAEDTPQPFLRLLAGAAVALAGGWLGRRAGVRLGFE